MSLLFRVRGFYLLNKQEKHYHKIAWIVEQTIEEVPVLESLSTIFQYSTVVCLQHQPWILSSPYYSMCAASNL